MVQRNSIIFYRILELDDLRKQQTNEVTWLIKKYYLGAAKLHNKKTIKKDNYIEKKNQHCKNGLLWFILFFIYDIKYKKFVLI